MGSIFGKCGKSDEDAAKRRRFESSEPFLSEVSCPPDKVGLVIGKGGESIRSLEQEYGVRIQHVDGVFRVSGSDGAVAEAVARIKAMVTPVQKSRSADVSEPFVSEVSCSPDKVGLVIGKQGQTIRSLEQEYGVRIQHVDGVFRVSGSDGAVVFDAVARIKAMVTPVEIVCPPEKIGELIGPGGSTIKRIQAESGARVNVERVERGNPAKVGITGTPEAAAAARKAVLTIISPPSITVSCPPGAIGALMGQGGSNWKEIEKRCGEGAYAQTGVYVQISLEPPDRAGGAHKVCIEAGTAAALRQCKEEVEREIQNALKAADYEGDEGREWRKKAEKLYTEAKQSSNKADRDRLYERAREADEKAARAIFYRRNDGEKLRIDLHGLRVAEAERYLQLRLEELLKNDIDDKLEVITGAGHHSPDGLARIRQRVVELSKERGLRTEVINPGSMIVHC
eukprot:Hpha_TRINITY_DN16833_c2_g7::TRINITY_DN16833_c2_g7_i1::g.153573::m.153573/K13210/FUBP; far upstream element-binding protein